MKKRLLSLLLVLAVVFSFSLSAFATDTGIDIIDDPLSYYFENQMLGVQKGTGVTLVCPKCDYKVVYTGGTLVTCPYDGEALVLADLAGVHAEKVPSGIGRKDLPGYIDNSGTAHVSKEGKLKFVAHPCWLDVGEQESNKFTLTDPYKPYRVQEEDEDYGLYVYDWLGYNNGISHFSLYTQPLSDDMYYGNFDFYWIIDSGFVPGTYYVAADQPTVKNFYSKYGAEPQILKTKAGEYNLPNDSYWGLGNLGLSDYNAVWHERRWFYAENAKSTSIDIYLYPFLVTCDPTENPVEEKKEVTIEDNKFTGNIYVDNSTNITYIYPKYTTVNVNNETVIEVADHPLIYNPESKTYYVYDQTTNNYYNGKSHTLGTFPYARARLQAPAGAATGAQYGLLGPHEQSHQRERLLCLSVSLYLGHAWQEQKSREGGDFLRAANTTPEGWRFAERRKYYPTFTSATDKP